MTKTYSNEIRIVIGSWGSYNECNERALGSRWLDLADYGDWDEIVEELERQGFELDGIDEELFMLLKPLRTPLAPNSKRSLRSPLRICARVTRKLHSQDLKAGWVVR